MFGRNKGTKPTRKQMKIYRWIQAMVQAPSAPSVTEVAHRFGMTGVAVHEAVNGLVELGYLERTVIDGTPCYQPTQTCAHCGKPVSGATEEVAHG